MIGTISLYWFPCSVNDANVVSTLSYTTGPGVGCELLGNPNLCEEGAFKVSRWHVDLNPPLSGAPGEGLTSPDVQELCIHLATDQLSES